MSIEILSEFFKWMSILTGGVLIFWALWLILAPNFVYKLQNKFFPMKREYYDKVIYAFMAAAKLFFLFFCLAPYIALSIIA